jgi:hypothetical protein
MVLEIGKQEVAKEPELVHCGYIFQIFNNTEKGLIAVVMLLVGFCLPSVDANVAR